jgi:hypothetical protein
MSISLEEILRLVGPLDDSPGDDTARERFRRFLKNNVKEVGQIRDYVEACLRNSGDEYNRALQDLVNYVGEFLGFEVTFGRYRGVPGQVGFDGHWKSPMGFHAVVEVKTTETYAVRAATLVGYVDELISEKKVPNWDSAIGLYVVGRPDPAVHQVENAIVAEKRTYQLRIISVESLLSLAEMMSDYDVSHGDILAVLRPSGPTVDPVVDLMARLVAQRPAGEAPKEPVEAVEAAAEKGAAYWLTPVKGDEEQTAEEVVKGLVGQERIYAFGERTPGRKHLKPGDWICIYAAAKGVIAHARVASSPEKKKHPQVRHPEKYPWTFRLDNTRIYLEDPIVIDAATRSRLEAFQGRDPDKPWAWFVQATRRVSERDFKTLTRIQSGH